MWFVVLAVDAMENYIDDAIKKGTVCFPEDFVYRHPRRAARQRLTCTVCTRLCDFPLVRLSRRVLYLSCCHHVALPLSQNGTKHSRRCTSRHRTSPSSDMSAAYLHLLLMCPTHTFLYFVCMSAPRCRASFGPVKTSCTLLIPPHVKGS